MGKGSTALLIIVAAILGFLVGGALASSSGHFSNNSSLPTYHPRLKLKECCETLVGYKSISEPAGYYVYYTFTLDYPGYVEVIVCSSTTTNTYVEICGHSNQGISYSSGQVSVGTAGHESFPVLPGSAEVRIGNTNLINGATENIKIIYVYYVPSYATNTVAIAGRDTSVAIS
ncbi:hypothetical protein [Acidianus sp. HS-5]|uniref:hypothetical protein n=1 Tax=Acidianus sp. HS-5 TaxID=2886040 RepID=UPI001F2C73AA|nr:hypothetical protein [Acidianus sp. HS-5]BDC17524.1 hypothetical protein HS5_04140 [Acidianus sp. HS-5]